jgi:hypothetical protein
MVWRLFLANGYYNSLIDPAKNVVRGYIPSNFLTNGDAATATFALGAGGTIVNVDVRPCIPGAVDFGKSKRKAVKLTDLLVSQLSQGVPLVSGPPEPGAQVARTPIADPSGAISAPGSQPMYGHVGPIPVGQHILVNSIVLICICQILSIFNLILAVKTLKEYGQDDPGDKGLVIAGLVISSLVSLVVVAYIGLIFLVAVTSK